MGSLEEQGKNRLKARRGHSPQGTSKGESHAVLRTKNRASRSASPACSLDCLPQLLLESLGNGATGQGKALYRSAIRLFILLAFTVHRAWGGVVSWEDLAGGVRMVWGACHLLRPPTSAEARGGESAVSEQAGCGE